MAGSTERTRTRRCQMIASFTLCFETLRKTLAAWRWVVCAMLASFAVQPAIAGDGMSALERVLRDGKLVILADVKHGVEDRISFYSSPDLFDTMARAGVRHVAIEMPRVLGRQAMSVETESDVDLFVQDVIRSGRWHFTDPDGDGGDDTLAQYRVLTALARQVLLARRYGLSLIFYDFNNPLGGFTTQNDPVYRCLAQLSQPVWRRYGLNGAVTKEQRDAAIMRERFSHDDELAAYVERAVAATGGGKVVVIPGYAHAVLPGGLVERMESRLQAKATVVAVLKDEAEDKAFHSFLWQQARMLSIDLSRPPQYYYTIATNALRRDEAPGRYVALDGTNERSIPSVCYQLALDPR